MFTLVCDYVWFVVLLALWFWVWLRDWFWCLMIWFFRLELLFWVIWCCFYYVLFNDLLLWVWFNDWIVCWLTYFISLVVCWLVALCCLGFFWVWLSGTFGFDCFPDYVGIDLCSIFSVLFVLWYLCLQICRLVCCFRWFLFALLCV